MKLLITGISGLLGGVVAEADHLADYKLFGLSRNR